MSDEQRKRMERVLEAYNIQKEPASAEKKKVNKADTEIADDSGPIGDNYTYEYEPEGFRFRRPYKGLAGILLYIPVNLVKLIRYAPAKIRSEYPIQETPYTTKAEHKHNKYMAWTRRVFLFVLILVCILGFMFFLRPSESTLEKRTLTEFPKFTAASFMSGEYTSQISTWYADTFPFREKLIALDKKMDKLKGIGGEEVVGEATKGDEIPVKGEVESTLEEEQIEYEDGTIHDKGEKLGTVYVAGKSGFSYFGFDAKGSTNYAAMVNKIADRLEGTSHVYTLLAPTSMGIMLSDKRQKSIGSSDQKEAFEYIYGLLNDNVTPVRVYDTLKNHNAEYIYFRTDHHWTAKGAYYAYEEYMKAAGKTPCALEDYEKVKYKGFVGSFYTYSNQNSVFSKNPDTVTAYIPEVNELMYRDQNGNKHDGYVVNDVTGYDKEFKYLTFIMGDTRFASIKNDNVTDGSKCLVIKESYGNAFVPFLVNNYHRVYVVDYRYYKGDLTEFCKEKKVDDVIFLNNANAIYKDNVSLMYSIW